MGWQDAPIDDSYDVKTAPVPRSGIPAPGPSSVADDVMGMARTAGQWAKQGALPAIGSAALPAAATAMFPPAAGIAPILRGIGSGLGEVGNQALGITEPSWKQIAASTLIPMGMELGANLARTGNALTPALNMQAPQMATSQIAGYKSGVPSKQLFEQATREGVTIPLNETMTVLQDMRNSISNATPAGQKAFETVLKQTGLEDLATTPSGVSPAKMQNVLADIGKLQTQAAKEGGLKANYLGKFFSSLSNDLEQSGAALGPARQAFKREAVLNELDDAINTAFFIKKGQGSQGEFSANKVLNMLNKTSEGTGKFFAQAMTKGEQQEIKDLFGFLNTLPALKPGAGQNAGSLRFWERMTHAGAGGGIGAGLGFAATSSPIGAGIGAGIGMLAPEVGSAFNLMWQAHKMPGGNQILKSLLTNSDGALTPQVIGTLSAFVTGKRAHAGTVQPEQHGTSLRPMAMEQ